MQLAHMKVFPLFNEIKRDGMGSAAMTLVKAVKSQGIDVQPIHAWREVDFPEYEAECKPIFVENDGYGVDSKHLPRMVEKVNELANDGDVVINFGSANWLACIPYFNPGIRVITAVHSINPSTLKLGRAYPERISAFVCISKGVMDRFLSKLPRKFHNKVYLIPNAVDIAQNPKTDWSNDGVLRILFLGRIEATSKGCDKLPKILKVLKRRGVAAKLDLYGYFHNWKRQWWDAVDRAGVRDMVEYNGEISHEKVYEVMRDYDVFISPSNFEGFPLSNSEAMSCALPVVVSCIKGVTDWICDYGRCGITVRKMDVKGFADALERLAKSPVLREKFGRSARKRIMDLASVESHGRKYAELARMVSGQSDYVIAQPHCPLDHYVQPEFLKSWGLARLLPTRIKTWLRRFM